MGTKEIKDTGRSGRKAAAMKGISRIDSHSTHGYYVRAYKWGRVYSKLFSDSRHGGELKCLRAAKKYRDELVLKLEEAHKIWFNPEIEVKL